jgi:hypothetical protein
MLALVGDGIALIAESVKRKLANEQPQIETAQKWTSASPLTLEETLAYQNKNIGSELWLLEKHLAQGYRIRNAKGELVPCECCDKHIEIRAVCHYKGTSLELLLVAD